MYIADNKYKLQCRYRERNTSVKVYLKYIYFRYVNNSYCYDVRLSNTGHCYNVDILILVNDYT